MKTYHIVFTGRLIGAIGVFEKFVVTVQSESQEEARLKLYDTYEHIHVIDFHSAICAEPTPEPTGE